MIITKRVKLSTAQIEQSVTICIDNIVALAFLQVDEIENLLFKPIIQKHFLTSDPS